ncbi:unnamed protein product [Timema podura]|uniref:Uncharacterized protein n=1 Tax=Timema podura TaxID=61482 RepID=A0ABN7NP32_TIMPD|nr:unnamed protein product [Timema podura]
MKLFLVLLLAAPLVLAKPSHKSMRQGPDPEPGDNVPKIDGEGYLDELIHQINFEDESSPMNIPVPGHEDSFESNEKIYELLVSAGSVKSIEGVKRTGDVEVGQGDDGTSVLSSHLHISGAVLTYNYRVKEKDGRTVEEGKLNSHIDGVEASFLVHIHSNGHNYEAKLGDVETTALGHNDLDDAAVTMVINSVKNHYNLDVAAAAVEGLTGYLDSSIHKTDVSDFVEK